MFAKSGLMILAPNFIGNTADDVWRQAASFLTEDSRIETRQSRLGPCRELLHCSLTLLDPSQRWILSRSPAINPAFAIAEVVWLLAGRNDSAFVNFWNPALPRFCGEGPTYHGAYGHRLRYNDEFDQLFRAYEVLRENPDSRQVVLQIWHSLIDMPFSDGSPRNKDIPCNVVAMPKIRDGKLEWMQVMRSNDLYLGTPHNFIQFTVLQEVLAGWLGVGIGNFVLVADSLHLYEKDLETCSVLRQQPTERNTDSLLLSKPDFDAQFQYVLNAMTQLADAYLDKKEILPICKGEALGASWRNMLAIAAADSARRHGWSEETSMAASICSNPALTKAWAAWNMRCSTELNQ